MKNTLLLFLLSILVLGCEPSPKAPEISQLEVLQDSLTTALQEILQTGEINGFGVAIVNEEGSLYEAGIGCSKCEESIPYQAGTVQAIASISKTLIGVALLKAQEMGKLKLDDPVNKHLPFKVVHPTFPEEDITIRQLATHTSSIQDNDFYGAKAYILRAKTNSAELDSIALNEQFNAPETMIPMLEFLEKNLTPTGPWYDAETFTEHQPGTIYEYTNVGATLAATVLALATGQSYADFTRQHILEPLGMQSSGWAFEDINLNQHTTLYAAPEMALPLYSLITYPDGGLITSASDLGKFLTELIKGQSGTGTLLKKESYAEIFRPQLTAENLPDRNEGSEYDDEYNSGIFMGFTPTDYIGHSGGDPGVGTYMFFNPSTKSGRIMMINTSIRNQQGVDDFFAIWRTLGEFEARLLAAKGKK